MDQLVLKERDILRNNTRRIVEIRDSSRKRSPGFLRLGILLCASADFLQALKHFSWEILATGFSQIPQRPILLCKSTIMIEIFKQNLYLRLGVGQTI